MNKLMTLTAAGFCLYMGAQNALAARTAEPDAAATSAAVPAVDAVDAVTATTSTKNLTDRLTQYVYNIYEMEKAIDGVQKMKMDCDDAFCCPAGIELIPSEQYEINQRLGEFQDDLKIRLASMYELLEEYKQMVDVVRASSVDAGFDFEHYESSLNEKMRSLLYLVEETKDSMHGFWANWLESHELNNFAHYKLGYIKALDMRREVYDWKNTLTYLNLQPNRGVNSREWNDFLVQKRGEAESMDSALEEMFYALRTSIDEYSQEDVQSMLNSLNEELQNKRNGTMDFMEQLLQERAQPVEYGPSEWATCEGVAAIVAVERRIDEAHLKFEKFKDSPYAIDVMQRRDLISSFEINESMLRAQLEEYYSDLQDLVARNLIHNGLYRFKEDLATINFDNLDSDLNQAAYLLRTAMTSEANYNRMVQIERNVQLDGQARLETMDMISVLIDDEALTDDDYSMRDNVLTAAQSQLMPRFSELQSQRKNGQLSANDVMSFEYAAADRIEMLNNAVEAFMSLALKSLQETDETSPRFRYVQQQIQCADMHNRVQLLLGMVRTMATYQPVWLNVGDNDYRVNLSELEGYCMTTSANCNDLAKSMSEAYRDGEYEVGAAVNFDDYIARLQDDLRQLHENVASFRNRYTFDAPDYDVYGVNDVALQQVLVEKLRLGQRAGSLMYTFDVTPAMLGEDSGSDDYADVNDAIESFGSRLMEVESAYAACLAMVKDVYAYSYAFDLSSTIDDLTKDVFEAQATCSSLREMLYDFFKPRFAQQNGLLMPLYIAYLDGQLQLKRFATACSVLDRCVEVWEVAVPTSPDSEDLVACVEHHHKVVAELTTDLEDLSRELDDAYATADLDDYAWTEFRLRMDRFGSALEQELDELPYFALPLLDACNMSEAEKRSRLMAIDNYKRYVQLALFEEYISNLLASIEEKPDELRSILEDVSAVNSVLDDNWAVILDYRSTGDEMAETVAAAQQAKFTELTAGLQYRFEVACSEGAENWTWLAEPDSEGRALAEVRCRANSVKTHYTMNKALAKLSMALVAQDADVNGLEELQVETVEAITSRIVGLSDKEDYAIDMWSSDDTDLRDEAERIMSSLDDSFGDALQMGQYILEKGKLLNVPFNYVTGPKMSYGAVENDKATMALQLKNFDNIRTMNFSLLMPHSSADGWNIQLGPAAEGCTLRVVSKTGSQYATVYITAPAGQTIAGGVVLTFEVPVMTTAASDEVVTLDDRQLIDDSGKEYRPFGCVQLPLHIVELASFDQNGDGDFDVADVEALSAAVSAVDNETGAVGTTLPDVNGDGQLTVSDIVVAIELLKGK